MRLRARSASLGCHRICPSSTLSAILAPSAIRCLRPDASRECKNPHTGAPAEVNSLGPMQNPLLELSRPIPFDQIREEHIEPAVHALLAEATAAIDAVAAHPGPYSYQSTLAALERTSEKLE